MTKHIVPYHVFEAHSNGPDREYLKWKRKNVTLRGIKSFGEPNEVFGSFGKGLYTVPLSNRKMAAEYGKVYFVIGAIPKFPKTVNNLNEAEILRSHIIADYCRTNGVDYSTSYFYQNTDIDQEMIKMGYDGLVIKGREMVNYTPGDDVRYFQTEDMLKVYYYSMLEHETD